MSDLKPHKTLSAGNELANLDTLGWVPQSIDLGQIDPQNLQATLSKSTPFFDRIASEIELDTQLEEILSSRSSDVPRDVEKTKLGMFLILSGHLIADDTLAQNSESGELAGANQLESILKQMLLQMGRLPDDAEITKWVTHIFLKNCRGSKKPKKLIKQAQEKGSEMLYTRQEETLRHKTDRRKNAGTVALGVIASAKDLFRHQAIENMPWDTLVDGLIEARCEIDPGCSMREKEKMLIKLLNQYAWLKGSNRSTVMSFLMSDDFDRQKSSIKNLLIDAFSRNEKFFSTSKALNATFPERGITRLAKPLRLLGGRVRLKVLEVLASREFFHNNFFTSGYFQSFASEPQGLWHKCKKRVNAAVDFCLGDSGEGISSVESWDKMVAEVLKAGKSGMSSVDSESFEKVVADVVSRIQARLSAMVDDSENASESSEALWSAHRSEGVTAFFRKHLAVTPSQALIDAVIDAEKASDVPFELLLTDILSPQEYEAYNEILEETKKAFSLEALNDPDSTAHEYLLACRETNADGFLKRFIAGNRRLSEWHQPEVFIGRSLRDMETLNLDNSATAQEHFVRIKSNAIDFLNSNISACDKEEQRFETELETIQEALKVAQSVERNAQGKPLLEDRLNSARAKIQSCKDRQATIKASLEALTSKRNYLQASLVKFS